MSACCLVALGARPLALPGRETLVPKSASERRTPQQPISVEEVSEWFHAVIKPRPSRLMPSDDLIQQYAAHLERQRDTITTTSKYDRKQPPLSLESIKTHGHKLRSDLAKFAVYGDGMWQCVGVDPSAISRLNAALAELGDFLRPLPKIKRGAKQRTWDLAAHDMASDVAIVLNKAGWDQVSVISASSSAIKIAAIAYGRIYGEQPEDATFASAVKAEKHRWVVKLRQSVKENE